MVGADAGSRPPAKPATHSELDSTMTRLLSFFLAVSIFRTPPQVSQLSLPDGETFLKQAKTNVTGQFTFTLALDHPEGFVWNFRSCFNRLDAKERRKKTTLAISGKVLISSDGQQMSHVLHSSKRLGREQMVDQQLFGFQAWSATHESIWSEVRDEIWEHTRFKLLGRETIDGRPTRAFAFTGGGMDESLLQRRIVPGEYVEGRIWFDEQDHFPMQLEATQTKTIGTFEKGSHWRQRLVKKDRSWLLLYTDWRYKRSFLWRHGYEQIRSDGFDFQPVPVGCRGCRPPGDVPLSCGEVPPPQQR